MKLLFGFWQKSLTAQLLSWLLIALFASQILGLAIVWDYMQADLRGSARAELSSRAAAVARLVRTAPPTLREDLIRISSTDTSRFWISDGRPVALESWVQQAFARFEVPLGELLVASDGIAFSSMGEESQLPAGADAEYFLKGATWTVVPAADRAELPVMVRYLDFAEQNGAGVIVPFDDGQVLNAAFYKNLAPSIWRTHLPLSLALTAVLVSLVAVITVRRIASPLRQLTQAAEMLGRGEAVSPLLERGPEDIRRTAVAFNSMQERLHRFVVDRTRMLAAIGHDLRTPLTTLKLRAEMVEDIELQERMLDTIDEMQAMTEATLSLVREETSVDPTRTIDLAALVESVCDDLAELGQSVRFVSSERLNYRCRPEGLRRVIRNLIENAVRYAGGAEVRLVVDPSAVKILVEDNGPGIPVDNVEEVFAPFFRLEKSRSRETGGLGLGLSIARAIARQHGGDIILAPREPGLQAAIVLPG
ncbi:ATP-binding protein [Pelagibacterium sp. H642]|uniref:ATP-binding protein n=1 Tax=Pelagibacterium sp. H642 TaxID=1881069 RepID=UPI00281529DB|nr:ATP-binding protein [Pelagibacterium sp. H642]WMT91921.1 ATP-binding protein [Pelagibacterium sp. H642]